MTDAPQTKIKATQPSTASFMVKGQYIKDLSFENPHAPQSLMAYAQKPAIDVHVDISSHKVQENLYETSLHIAARAVMQENTMFLVDLTYAGIFALSGIPQERVEAVVMVDCPFVLFPFARRVIADVTRDGGFPPLMLDPIDFGALYVQRKRHTEEIAS